MGDTQSARRTVGKGSKHKKGGKAKHIPKEVLGLKVPKELRRAGEGLIGAVLEKAQSPEGRQAIAGTLSMAAAALNATIAAERARTSAPERGAAGEKPATDAPPPPPPPPPLSPSAPPRGTTCEPDPKAIGAAIGRIAQAALAGWAAGRKGA